MTKLMEKIAEKIDNSKGEKKKSFGNSVAKGATLGAGLFGTAGAVGSAVKRVGNGVLKDLTSNEAMKGTANSRAITRVIKGGASGAVRHGIKGAIKGGAIGATVYGAGKLINKARGKKKD